jgi:hypothetical protein
MERTSQIQPAYGCQLFHRAKFMLSQHCLHITGRKKLGPCSEQVVHFRVVFVIGQTVVVRDADALLGLADSMPAARHFA